MEPDICTLHWILVWVSGWVGGWVGGPQCTECRAEQHAALREASGGGGEVGQGVVNQYSLVVSETAPYTLRSALIY